MHWKTKVNVWLLCWGVLQSFIMLEAGKKEGRREGKWGQSHAPNNWKSVTGAMIIINSGAWVPSRQKSLINHSVLPNFQLPIANSRHCLISLEGCEKPLYWPLPYFQGHLCDVHVSRLPGMRPWPSSPPMRGMFRTLCLWSWISSARVLPDSVSSGLRPRTTFSVTLCPPLLPHRGPHPGFHDSLRSFFNKSSAHHVSVGCVLLASRVLWDPEAQAHIFFISCSLITFLLLADYQDCGGLKLSSHSREAQKSRWTGEFLCSGSRKLQIKLFSSLGSYLEALRSPRW